VAIEEFIADLMSLTLFYLINQIVNCDYFHFEKADFFMVMIFIVFIINIGLMISFLNVCYYVNDYDFINFNDFLKINYQ
jgi:hypothetical protein